MSSTDTKKLIEDGGKRVWSPPEVALLDLSSTLSGLNNSPESTAGDGLWS